VMADVSKRLVDQFARNLAEELVAEGGPVTDDAGEMEDATTGDPSYVDYSTASFGTSGPRFQRDTADQSLDVLSLLRDPARRLLPPLAAGFVIGLLLGRITKRSTVRWPAGMAYLQSVPPAPQP
jgi:uncharacterized protein